MRPWWSGFAGSSCLGPAKRRGCGLRRPGYALLLGVVDVPSHRDHTALSSVRWWIFNAVRDFGGDSEPSGSAPIIADDSAGGLEADWTVSRAVKQAIRTAHGVFYEG